MGDEDTATDHVDVEVILKVDHTFNENEDDEDIGYYIVTEERATNCPSISGSLDTKEEEKKEGKKDGELHGKVKRWSKLLKYSMPSKPADKVPTEPKRKISPKDRKSLKDKMKENDFVVFLTERRAVSESRFRVMDMIGNPTYLVRTKSEQSLVDEAWNSGVSTGSVKEIRSKFEDEDIDFCLQANKLETSIEQDKTVHLMENQETVQLDDNQNPGEERASDSNVDDKEKAGSPTLDKEEDNNNPDLADNDNVDGDASASQDEIKKVEECEDELFSPGSKSSGSSSSKINELSHESSNEETKKIKKEEKEKKKAEKKDKKEKKKVCTTCANAEEHKEHRKEKKKAKKDKAEKKKLVEEKEVKKTINIATSDSASLPAHKVRGENFFQKLLIKEEIDKHKVERPSRPRKQNKEKRPYVKSSQPSLGLFLKGKEAVSNSIFKQYDQLEKFLENQTLPKGVIMNDDSPVRIFQQNQGPMFPRSISNLERISSRKTSAERASSVLSNRSEYLDKRSYSLPRPGSSLSQPRPGSSMSQRSDSSFIMDQMEYRNYVYEMVHSTPKNDRFCKLQEYFTTLDRVIKLETEASKMEIHKLNSEDIVDFDTWREMRKKEKAKDELDFLLKDLKTAQKEREFHFRPREVENYKWKGDSRLSGRDRSVENLKTIFDQKLESGEIDLTRSLPKNFMTNSSSWLGKQEEKSKAKEIDAYCSRPSSKASGVPYFYSNTQRSRSSLSTDQVSSLKNQLNDLLSSRASNGSNASSKHSSRSPSRHEFTIEVTNKVKPLENLFVRPVPEIVKKSLEEAQRNLEKYTKERSRSKEDEERFKLSKTINEELMKRVNFKEESMSKTVDFDSSEKRVPLKFQNKQNNASKRDTSPRVCYSLESEEEKQDIHNESSDFILVLSDDEKKNDKVTEIIDKWASADSEEESKRFENKRKKKGGKLNGAFSSQSSDSISSGTSIHTVIYQPPRSKLDIIPIEEVEIPDCIHERSFEEIRKSFEKMEEPQPREALSPTNEDLNIPPNTVKEIRKSFENMPLPNPPSKEELTQQEYLDLKQEISQILPPKTPVRSSSFHKALGTGRKAVKENPESKKMDKESPLSRSASSIPENLNDEGYSTFPNSPRKASRQVTYLEKSYIPEKSISNVDLTDTENNSLDETFGKMHEKVHSLGDSNDGKVFSRTVSRDFTPAHPAKYSRAYLLVSKTGDVKGKRMQFEQYGGNITKSLPAVNPEFIKKHATDTSRVVIKNQEVANVNHIKSRLEKCANKSDDIFDYCGAILTKNKLKYFCKKVGHSKILSKMSSLQKTGKIEDCGFEKLSNKTNTENDYMKKYHSGDVENKKSVFENKGNGIQCSEKDLPKFRWSQRFENDLPNPGNSYTKAQKQNQFRNYYGYLPADAPRTPLRTDSRTYFRQLEELTCAGSRKPIYHPQVQEHKSSQADQPSSLPAFQLSSQHAHPPYLPPPPYRANSAFLGMS